LSIRFDLLWEREFGEEEDLQVEVWIAYCIVWGIIHVRTNSKNLTVIENYAVQAN